jgi:hypothetical protein
VRKSPAALISPAAEDDMYQGEKIQSQPDDEQIDQYKLPDAQLLWLGVVLAVNGTHFLALLSDSQE